MGGASFRTRISHAAVMPTNFIYWWKADALALSDGAAVGTWTDSSSHSWAATQSTAGQKPIFKAAPTGFNGQPALQFTNASSQRLVLPYNATVNPAAITIFVAFQPTSVALLNAGGFIQSRNTASNQAGYYVLSKSTLAATPSGVFWSGAGGEQVNTGSIPAAGVTHVLAVDSDGTTGSGYLDGTVDDSNVAAAFAVNTTGDLIIGHAVGFFGQDFYYDGYIAEIIGYPSRLNSTDRGAVFSYLQTKYGV